MTVIDAHHHLRDLARRPRPGLCSREMTPIRCSFGLADLASPASVAGVQHAIRLAGRRL